MKHEIIIKCESKEEIECICIGLDLYRRDLISDIRKNTMNIDNPDNKMVKIYQDTLSIVNKMITDLDKDF